MSDLTRALRKAEDQLTDALVDEALDGGPDSRFAGLHEVMKNTIIRLREVAGMVERYEDAEAIGANVGGYIDSHLDGQHHD